MAADDINTPPAPASPPDPADALAWSDPAARRRAVAVMMQCRPLANRWITEVWEPVAVYDDTEAGAPPRVLPHDTADGIARRLHTGFVVELFRDEAEGYFLNLTTDTPFAFVEWDAEDGPAAPRWVTLSYNEAARRIDGGAQIDGVPMPAEWLPWLARFTQAHYHPDAKKKRIRPASFKGAKRDA